MNFEKLMGNAQMPIKQKLHAGIGEVYLGSYQGLLVFQSETLANGIKHGTAAAFVVALGLLHLRSGASEALDALPLEARTREKALAVVSKL